MTTAITKPEIESLKLTHEKLYGALKMSFKILGTSGVFKHSENLNKKFDEMTLHLNPTREDCYTDFKGVYIGLMFKYIKEGNLDQAYNVAEIIIAHEVGHLRFTNKKAWDSFVFKSPSRYGKLSFVARDILNIVEDRREEYHMSQVSLEVRDGFYWLCQRLGEDVQKTFDEEITSTKEFSTKEKINHLRNGILYMSCTRLLPKMENEEILDYLKQIFPLMIYSYKTNSTNDAVVVTEKIMEIIKPLKDALEEEKEDKMSAMFDIRTIGSYEPMEGEDMEEFKEKAVVMSGASEEELKEETLPEEIEKMLKELAKKVKEELEKGEEKEGEKGSEGSSEDDEAEKRMEKKGSKSSTDEGEEDESGGEGEDDKTSDEEADCGKPPISDVVEDIAARLDEYQDKIKKKAKEKEKKIEEELKKPVTKDLMEDFLHSTKKTKDQKVREAKEEKKLTELKPSFDKSLHAGIRVIFKDKKKMPKFPYADYSAILTPMLHIVKKTSEELKTLSEKKYHSILRMQRKGRLDRRSIINASAFGDDKAFKKKQLHVDKFDMDVMLLVDSSGSNASVIRNKKNNSQMRRYEMNQIVSVLVHEALKGAKFPHAIWSFDERVATEIAPMVDFANCFQKDVGLNLREIGAYGNNRDGLAIAHAGEYLQKHGKSNKKLLIVLSDGQPAANGYGGHKAMQDVKGQVDALKAKGINTIGIFTGHESENQYFKLMYGSHLFANNESIFKLPKELKNLLIKEFEDYLKKF